MEEVSCKGKTSTGAQCNRTTGLSKTGFCFQHAKQQLQGRINKEEESEQHPVNVEDDIQDSSNVVIGPSKAQTPHPKKPELFKKQQQPPPAAASAKRTDTIINDNNSVEVISVDSRSNSQVQEGSSSNDNNNSSDQVEEGELPRCTAIAATTKKRCKKFVSVAGEHHCPAHGGAQIRAKMALPQCQALSAKNRTPCKNKISMQGENFCSHHGGKQRGLRQVLVQDPSLSNSSEGRILVPGTPPHGLHRADVNWADIQHRCLIFVLENHGACTCTMEEPCQSFALVLWAQKASKIAHASPGKSLFGATQAQLSTLLPEQNHGLFADLNLAVQLFGGNMSIVPQLFQHIQNSFPKEGDVNNNNNTARGLFQDSKEPMDEGDDVL